MFREWQKSVSILNYANQYRTETRSNVKIIMSELFMIFVTGELYQKFIHPCAPQLK